MLDTTHRGLGDRLRAGVKGAGLASSLAVAIGVVALWAYFKKAKNYLTLNRRQWRPQIEQGKRILSVGLPAGGEFVIIFPYIAAIYYAIGQFGPAAKAGSRMARVCWDLFRYPRWPSLSRRPQSSDRFSAREIASV
jgi:Na+-driven multidrug efflux pump